MELRQSYPLPSNLHLDSRDILWLCLVLSLILAIAFLLPVHPNDYWWYLRLGDEILHSRAVPTIETWSASQAGQPVIQIAWLSAVLFHGLFQAGGLTATVLARGMVLAGFYACVYLAARWTGAGPRLCAVLVTLAALIGSSNWGIRPQMFVYPLFGLTVLLLVRWHTIRERWLWLLPPITLLWVNLHGSFPLVFLLVILALAGGTGNRRDLLIVLMVMSLASLATPHGSGAWAYFFKMLADPEVHRFSSEWKPVSLGGWQMALFIAWVLASIPLASLSPRRLPWSYWLWWLAYGLLAFNGIRNVIWCTAILVVVSAALIAPLLSYRKQSPKLQARLGVNVLIAVTCLALSLVFLPGLRPSWWVNAPPGVSPETPVQAAEWLNAHPDRRGRTWNDLAFSSYLIYAVRDLPVWIDTRFEVYPAERWERYQAIAAAEPGWEDHLEADHIGLVVANPAGEPALIAALRGSPAWCPVFDTPGAVIFERKEPVAICPETIAGR